MRRLLPILTLLCVLGTARADKAGALMDRLSRAAAESTLYAPDLKPWHLKVAVTLYDEQGANPKSGVIEEWWAGPDQDRITYTFANFTGTRLRTPLGTFHSTGMAEEPYGIEELHDAIVSPMPSKQMLDKSVPQATDSPLRNVKLDCILLSGKGQHVDLNRAGIFPTYCFTAGQDELRVSLQFMVQSLLRNGMGRFQGQSVATDVRLSNANITLGEGKVQTLQTIAASSVDLSTAGFEKQDAVGLSSNVVAGRLLSRVSPEYPERARQQHIQGAVLLGITIGKDGHVQHFTVRYSSSPYLTGAAVEAVKQWVYQPYVVNGQPTEVHSTVAVEFNFMTF